MVGQEGGVHAAVYGGSQVRNWGLSEVGLHHITPVCKAGSSYVTNGSLDLS